VKRPTKEKPKNEQQSYQTITNERTKKDQPMRLIKPKRNLIS